jgi:hypothetical protein
VPRQRFAGRGAVGSFHLRSKTSVAIVLVAVGQQRQADFAKLLCCLLQHLASAYRVEPLLCLFTAQEPPVNVLALQTPNADMYGCASGRGQRVTAERFGYPSEA